MKLIALWIGAVLLTGAGFVGGIAYRHQVTQASNHAGHAGEQRRILYYVDPMHPAYKSDKPGIAPDCGMKLVPVYEDDPMAGHSAAAQSGFLNVSADKQQLIGVEYGDVTLASSNSSFRAVGKVSPDERRVVHVHTRFEGWIEKVEVDFNGAHVEKGQPMATIYSPEMLASQQELLLAIQARDILKSSPLKEVADNSDSLIRAARMRLELWDLGRAQIEEIEKSGKAQRSITLFAPAAGFVTARNVFPNQKVTPESELYTLLDLSRVWITADVFEGDADKVRVGQTAVVALPNETGRGLVAKVSYIQPQVDPVTRTLKVRLDAPNPGMQYRPDMFVDLDFQVVSRRKISVPAEAVLDAGLRKTVFVDHGNGSLEPRQVETGERLGDRIEIVKGLKPGERIVTSGNFLIDSESQLKDALKSSSGSAHQHGAAPGAPPGEHQHD